MAVRDLCINPVTVDTILNSMTGIVEFANGITHICIQINGVRGYFDCINDQGVFTLLSFMRTC